MTIDPIERNKLSTIVFSPTEPLSTNVLWGKPVGNNVTFYIFRNGSWEKLKSEEIDEVVKVYVDNQDAITLNSAKEYADVVSKIAVVTSTDSVIALAPNKMYELIPSADTTIALQTPVDTNIVNEYMLEIIMGDTAYSITLPSEINWGEDEPTFEANTLYEISIRYSSKGYLGLYHNYSL